MTEKKLHVAMIFGGRSGEHEVSLMSARSVLSVLDPAKYEVTQVGITQEGTWLTRLPIPNRHLAFPSRSSSPIRSMPGCHRLLYCHD